MAIRATQANWADDDSPSRREAVRSDVRRALESVPKPEWKERLGLLRTYFPALAGDRVQNPGTAHGKHEAELSPRQLVERLCRLGPELQIEERLGFARKLLEAGFLVERTIAAPPVPVPPPDFDSVLGLLLAAETRQREQAVSRLQETLPKVTGGWAPTAKQDGTPPSTGSAKADAVGSGAAPAAGGVGDRLGDRLAKVLDLPPEQRVYFSQVQSVLEALLVEYIRLDEVAARVSADFKGMELEGSVLKRRIAGFLQGDPKVTRDRLGVSMATSVQRLTQFLRLPSTLPERLARSLERKMSPDNLAQLGKQDFERLSFVARQTTKPEAKAFERYRDFWDEDRLAAVHAAPKSRKQSAFWGARFDQAVSDLLHGEGTGP